MEHPVYPKAKKIQIHPNALIPHCALCDWQWRKTWPSVKWSSPLNRKCKWRGVVVYYILYIYYWMVVPLWKKKPFPRLQSYVLRIWESQMLSYVGFFFFFCILPLKRLRAFSGHAVFTLWAKWWQEKYHHFHVSRLRPLEETCFPYKAHYMRKSERQSLFQIFLLL